MLSAQLHRPSCNANSCNFQMKQILSAPGYMSCTTSMSGSMFQRAPSICVPVGQADSRRKISVPPAQSKVKAKAPYSQYDALASEGVTIAWGDPSDAASLPDGPFDVVYDNNGKKLDVCKAAIDKYKVRTACCGIASA